jgi:hypothetical protein
LIQGKKCVPLLASLFSVYAYAQSTHAASATTWQHVRGSRVCECQGHTVVRYKGKAQSKASASPGTRSKHHQKGRHGLLLVAAAGNRCASNPSSQQQTPIQQGAIYTHKWHFFLCGCRGLGSKHNTDSSIPSLPSSSCIKRLPRVDTLRTAAKKTSGAGLHR